MNFKVCPLQSIAQYTQQGLQELALNESKDAPSTDLMNEMSTKRIIFSAKLNCGRLSRKKMTLYKLAHI
jgi:hypothetical protein